MIFDVKKGNAFMDKKILEPENVKPTNDEIEKLLSETDEEVESIVESNMDDIPLRDEDGNIIEGYVTEEEHGEFEEYSTTALTEEELEEYLNQPDNENIGYSPDEEARG